MLACGGDGVEVSTWKNGGVDLDGIRRRAAIA
jgi:hypothetical protein